jgi:ABC-type antimicrobial peptide transport system permease subunit
MSLLTLDNITSILKLNPSIVDIENYKVNNYCNPYNPVNSQDYRYIKNGKINIQLINETVINEPVEKNPDTTAKVEEIQEIPEKVEIPVIETEENEYFIDYLMSIFDKGSIKPNMKDLDGKRLQFIKWFQLQINSQEGLSKPLMQFYDAHKKMNFVNLTNQLRKLYFLQIVANCLEIFFIIDLKTPVKIIPNQSKNLLGYKFDKDFNLVVIPDKTTPFNLMKYQKEYDEYHTFTQISDKNKVAEIEEYLKFYEVSGITEGKKKMKKEEYLKLLEKWINFD